MQFFYRHKSIIDVEKLQKDLPDLIEILDEPVIQIEENNNIDKSATLDSDENKNIIPKKQGTIRLVPIQLCAIRIENLIKVINNIEV